MKNTGRMWWGIVLIILGFLMLLDKTDVVDFSDMFRTYWPIVLVGLGIWIIIKRNESRDKWAGPVVGVAGDRTVSNGAEMLSESTVFGNVDVNVRSTDFKGGDVSTVFGNCIVDLTGARAGAGEYTLKVGTVFGKVEILVPTTIAVKASAETVLGSITLNGQKRDGMLPASEWISPGYATALSRLRIDASAVLGEVLVTSVVR
jgi:predicted membrane protein